MYRGSTKLFLNIYSIRSCTTIMLYQIALIKQKKQREVYARLSHQTAERPLPVATPPQTEGKRRLEADQRYLLAQEQLQLGDWQEVLGITARLQNDYPNDAALTRLHEEAERKQALQELWQDKVKERRQYSGILRWLALMATLLLCGGLIFGSWQLFRTTQKGKAFATIQQSLLAEAESAMQQYDYRTAVDLYRQVLAVEPGHQMAAKGLDRAVAQSVLDNEYREGVEAFDSGFLIQAEAILAELDRKAPNYRDTRGLLAQIATTQAPLRPVTPTVAAVQQLATPPTATVTPSALQPFSGQIAFRSNRDGEADIYLMQADGSQQQRAPDDLFAEFEALYQQQQWTQGSSAQVYAADAPARSDWNLYMRQQPTADAEPVVTMLTDFPGIEAEAVWSPDGLALAFVANHTGNEEIWTLALPAQTVHQLTHNDWAWDKHPTWSPDGGQLAFYSNRSGRRQIWTMHADGTNQQNLSNNRYEDWDPVWIP